MSVRETSVAAYLAGLKSGIITESRALIFDILLEQLPKPLVDQPRPAGVGLTAAEVREIMRARGLKAESHDSPRFTELRDQGAIYENMTKVCSVTGYRKIAWAPTWSQAVIPFSQKKETLKAQIVRLEGELAECQDTALDLDTSEVIARLRNSLTKIINARLPATDDPEVAAYFARIADKAHQGLGQQTIPFEVD